MTAVASSLFKLSSGLTSKVVEFSLDDFVAQVDDMVAVDNKLRPSASKSDWFSRHPFSPLRVKALKLFEASELYLGDNSRLDLELNVQSLLSMMEPSYLAAKTDTARVMRSLLFTGLIAVADASGDRISEEELGVFAQFFGKYSFDDRLEVEKIKEMLPSRIKSVKEKASQTQCMQIMNDLCVMARADGGVCASERVELERISEGLGVETAFIDKALGRVVELD